MNLLRRRLMMEQAGGEKVEMSEVQTASGGHYTWYTDGGEEKYTGSFSGRGSMGKTDSASAFGHDTALEITIKSDGAQVYPYFALACWDEATNLYYVETIGNMAWTTAKQNITAQYTVRAGYKFTLFFYVNQSSKFTVTIKKG